jgi:hypothetical protein
MHSLAEETEFAVMSNVDRGLNIGPPKLHAALDSADKIHQRVRGSANAVQSVFVP